MTQTPIQTVKQRVQEVLAYCIEFLAAGESRSVIVLPQPDGSVMTGQDDLMQGLLPSGRTIQIPIDAITNVFQTRYKVTANWSGNGHKSQWVDESQIVDMAETGQTEKISRIKNQEGETVYQKYENLDSIKADREAKKRAKPED